MTTSIYRLIPADQQAVVPWKNGGGTTTELAQGLARASDQEWSWRISLADVEQSGPFSIFAGIDRITCVVEGDGMDLRHEDGSLIALEPNQLWNMTWYNCRRSIEKTRFETSTSWSTDDSCVTVTIVRGPNALSVKLSAARRCSSTCSKGSAQTPANRSADTLSTLESLIVQDFGEVSVRLEPMARAVIVTLEELRRLN